jgi:hypothetical protein
MSDIALQINENAAASMRERGIREEDIRQVLDYAKESGVFLRDGGEDLMLAKKRIGSFTFYVKCKGEGPYEILDTYSHRVMLTEDETV